MWRNEWNNILFLSSFSLLFAVSPGTIEVAELVTNNKKMQHPDWLLPLSLWPVKFIHCCTVAQLTPPTFLLLFWLSPPPSLPSAVSAWCRGWGKRINTHTHIYTEPCGLTRSPTRERDTGILSHQDFTNTFQGVEIYWVLFTEVFRTDFLLPAWLFLFVCFLFVFCFLMNWNCTI